MTRKEIKKMLLEIIAQLDYDIYKSFLRSSSEDWEEAKEEMNQLIKIAKKHIKRANAKKDVDSTTS